MDCDDATLLVAAAEARTLNVSEATKLHAHAEGCTECRELLVEQRQARMHSIVSIPEDALDDRDLLVLPLVDPSVFISDGELARGGMGRVLRVRDRRLGRDVAIKEVIGAGMRARFEREVMITAQLQHPAIIPVYEAGTWPNGAAFYTMRLVSGGTLGDEIDKTKTIEERLALLPHVVALTDALAFAHSKRIVHRDLKPGNVLVGEFGETVVIDWGLAKDLDRADAPGDDTAPTSSRPDDGRLGDGHAGLHVARAGRGRRGRRAHRRLRARRDPLQPARRARAVSRRPHDQDRAGPDGRRPRARADVARQAVAARAAGPARDRRARDGPRPGRALPDGEGDDGRAAPVPGRAAAPLARVLDRAS